jgi:hypothetical protein
MLLAVFQDKQQVPHLTGQVAVHLILGIYLGEIHRVLLHLAPAINIDAAVNSSCQSTGGAGAVLRVLRIRWGGTMLMRGIIKQLEARICIISRPAPIGCPFEDEREHTSDESFCKSLYDGVPLGQIHLPSCRAAISSRYEVVLALGSCITTVWGRLVSQSVCTGLDHG